MASAILLLLGAVTLLGAPAGDDNFSPTSATGFQWLGNSALDAVFKVSKAKALPSFGEVKAFPKSVCGPHSVCCVCGQLPVCLAGSSCSSSLKGWRKLADSAQCKECDTTQLQSKPLSPFAQVQPVPTLRNPASKATALQPAKAPEYPPLRGRAVTKELHVWYPTERLAQAQTAGHFEAAT